jgi:hypothetical protein
MQYFSLFLFLLMKAVEVNKIADKKQMCLRDSQYCCSPVSRWLAKLLLMNQKIEAGVQYSKRSGRYPLNSIGDTFGRNYCRRRIYP